MTAQQHNIGDALGKVTIISHMTYDQDGKQVDILVASHDGDHLASRLYQVIDARPNDITSQVPSDKTPETLFADFVGMVKSRTDKFEIVQ